ncbi:hypothetical protein Dsin_014526 [Dipteronia sinensis]|uniref:Reverse transcriptase zinc-binding domain-containing protein n=1 Tax=Dipteronia sinensis TaxID=43782 RepID=A0AAE0ALY1_9ROSI|nr:hypothetical protein Dsin_014526 [Dipteronia sinensis]
MVCIGGHETRDSKPNSLLAILPSHASSMIITNEVHQAAHLGQGIPKEDQGIGAEEMSWRCIFARFDRYGRLCKHKYLEKVRQNPQGPSLPFVEMWVGRFIMQGSDVDASCPRCFAVVEDVDHKLRGCSVSCGVWDYISKGVTSSHLFKGGLEEWLVQNLQNDNLVTGKIPNYLQFASTLWFLWKWRCKKIFDVDFSIPHPPHLIINSFAKNWLAANCPVSARIGFVFLVAWNPPNEGWIKLNIDGSRESRDTNSGIITAGGVM